LVTQLALFLENKPGRIEEVTRLLAEAGINLRGMTLSSQGDYGVMKLIPDNPEKAFAVLQQHHFNISQMPVLVALIQDKPGSLHHILKLLSAYNINIEECYGIALEQNRNALIVLEVDNYEQAEALFLNKGITLLTDKEIHTL
jgi:hypothetical protein